MTSTTDEIDEQDELDFFTNSETVAKAVQEGNRGNFRPKFTHVITDFTNDDISPFDRTLTNGTEVRAVALRMVNMEVLACARGEIFADDQFDYVVNLPKNPYTEFELNLMVQSARAIDPKIKSLRHFSGLKKVELEERVHHYTGRGPTGEKDTKEFKDDGTPNTQFGKDIWGDVKRQTYYYHVVKIGNKAGSTSAAPDVKSSSPTLAGIAAAMTIITNAGSDGMKLVDFNKACMQDKIIQKDTALTSQITDGSWLKKQIDDGVLMQADDVIMTSVSAS